jgi:hypothetical protein
MFTSPQGSAGLGADGFPCFTQAPFWQIQLSSPLRNRTPKITAPITAKMATMITIIFAIIL